VLDSSLPAEQYYCRGFFILGKDLIRHINGLCRE